ncbi:MAG: hypothetical protein IBJ03_02875 [Gemmatimonadaceae bacterium]|nr:hypothetical protein [Gemmatimonadaceae bacterium]
MTMVLPHQLRHLLVAFALATALEELPAQARRDSPAAGIAPATRAAIELLVDSLTSERLPGDALRDKMAEGVLKGADDQRILIAVRSLASRLRDARGLLGPGSDSDELKATASALFVGVDRRAIVRLAEARRKRGSGTSLTVPMTIVTDLAMQRVPLDIATSSMESLLEGGALDRDLNAFRRGIERDLQQGKTPRDAVSTGVRTTLNGMNRTP